MAKKMWPDLSAYGVYFGVLKAPDGTPTLMMVDETGSFSSLAKQLKMNRTRWIGLWSSKNLKFTIDNFQSMFPKGRVVELEESEISSLIIEKFSSRQHLRFSQVGKEKVLSWHPNRVSPAKQVADMIRVPGGEREDRKITAVLNETLYLGLNFEGKRIYERGDGVRFASTDGIRQEVIEDDKKPGYQFLRGTKGDVESITFCAEGLIHEMAERRLNSSDFERYLAATYGADLRDSEREESIAELQIAIDKAIISTVKRAPEDRRADTVIALHENRASFWRPAGTLPTPAPISYFMQSIVEPHLKSDSIIADTDLEGAHTWATTKGAQVGADATHDFFIGGSFNNPMESVRFGGLSIQRADHHMMLSSLEKRSADGLSVFLVIADPDGKLSAENKRVLSKIGTHYSVIGVTDIDGAMVSAGNSTNSRLVVIGPRLMSENFSFSLPGSVPVIRDYETLGRWANAAHRAYAGEEDVVFPVENELNSSFDATGMQSPYIPSSQATEPAMMVPQNLLAPTRRALAALVERVGMGIDEFVADKLDLDIDSLGSRFSAEQVDAIALAIDAIDNKKAMIEADKTGVGKGRVLAAALWYGKKIGLTPLFFTETKELMSAIYRDIKDIGALDDFQRPTVINAGVQIVMPDKSVIRSLDAQHLFEGDEIARLQTDIILSTYSQFNRELESNRYEPEEIEQAIHIIDSCPSLISAVAMLNQAKSKLAILFNTGNSQVDGLLNSFSDGDESSVIEAIKEVRIEEGLDDFASDLMMSKDAAIKMISSYLPSRMQQRLDWISKVGPGYLLVVDESHNLAGITSNTGENMANPIRSTDAVIYSSATFASDEARYGAYRRAFPRIIDITKIPETLKAGGEPLKEIFTAMLASEGTLIRREQDDADVEVIKFEDKDRSERNRAITDKFAAIMNLIMLAGNEVNSLMASEIVNAESKYRQSVGAAAAVAATGGVKDTGINASMASSVFSGFHLINQQFLMCLNAGQTADLAIAALRNGLKPVIYYEMTNESLIRKVLEREGKSVSKIGVPVVLDAPVSFKDMLKNYLARITKTEIVVRAGRKVVERTQVEVASPELDAFIANASKLIDEFPDLAASPLDYVSDRIEAAGFSCLEYSGRELRLRDIEGTSVVVKRGKPKKLAIQDEFNNGTGDALIITKSGATGLDFHAAEKFRNQAQRVFIPATMPEDLTKFNQAKGRVNRKDQVTPPTIHIPILGLPSERRQLGHFNRTQRRHSASVAANADASEIGFEVNDLTNQIGVNACASFIASEPSFRNRLFPDGSPDNMNDLQRKLMARASMLPVADAEFMFQEIDNRYNESLKIIIASGFNPLTSHKRDIRAKIKSVTEFIPGDPGDSSVFSGPVMMTEVEYQGEKVKRSNSNVQYLASIRNEAKEAVGKPAAMFERIRKNLTRIMEENLPKDYATVDAAIVSKKPNQVQKMHETLLKGKELIESGLMQPGTVITIKEDGVPRDYFVHCYDEVDGLGNKEVRLSSMWVNLVGWGHKSFWGGKYTLGELINMSDLITISPDQGEEKICEILDAIFDRHEVFTQVMLTGNLYRAAEFAAQNRLGDAASFTDENGVWHQAIAISGRYGATDIHQMPFVVTKIDELMTYVNEHQGKIFFGSNNSRFNFALKHNTMDGNYYVEAYESPSATGQRPEICRILGLKSLAVGVPLSQMPKALEDLTKHATQPMLPGKYKAWLHEHRLALLEAAAAAEEARNQAFNGVTRIAPPSI